MLMKDRFSNAGLIFSGHPNLFSYPDRSPEGDNCCAASHDGIRLQLREGKQRVEHQLPCLVDRLPLGGIAYVRALL